MNHEEAFGRHLKELRLSRKLSLRKAADLVKIGHVRLVELEEGKTKGTGRPTRPRRELVVRLANAYCVSEASLLELAGYPVERPLLSEDEQRVIEVLRRLGDRERALVFRFVESMNDYARGI